MDDNMENINEFHRWAECNSYCYRLSKGCKKMILKIIQMS